MKPQLCFFLKKPSLVYKCKNIPSFNVVIQQNVINRVSAIKFLGILIDDKLTWKDHITYISSEIVKNVSVLNTFDCQSLKLIYCSLILPYLMYCVEIWGNSYKSNLVIMEKLQKRAIRIINGANYYDHTSKLLYSLKLSKFLDIVKCKTLQVMFKAYNMMLPINLQVMFSVVKDIYSWGLSIATIEYSCPSVCVCVSIFLCVCVSVYTITQKIMVQLTWNLNIL